MTEPDLQLDIRHGPDGTMQIAAGGRVYVRGAPGRRSLLFDCGTVTVEDQWAGRALLRTVRGAGMTVLEQHGFDATGLPVVIDGIRAERDAHGRIVACGVWRYGYDGAHLTAIDGPHGRRTIEHDADGRPVRVDGRALDYDHAGRRRDLACTPAGRWRDDAGRVWAELGAGGEIVRMWLWDGPLCVARVDGAPGAPLAAAFTHDASATPVRILHPAGSVAIARDAFGEALLHHPGVPGLYGGLVAGGAVHLRDRTLDPRTGSWNRPDPWDGSASDPRREELGPAPPLPVERQAAGAWAVARHDPVGRADPTGAMSFPLLLLSDLTHSSSNNLLSVFGLDLTINFWVSLVTLVPGRWFEFDTASAPSGSGAWGIVRNGRIAPPNAFTFQHLVFTQPAPLHKLSEVRMVDPRTRFAPALYGSVLRVAPVQGDPFTLAGAVRKPYGGSDERGLAWSRAGATAEPVVPGSRQPWFPAGALHLDTARSELRVDQAQLTELRAQGAPAQGTVVGGSLLVMNVPAGSAPPAAEGGNAAAELLVATGQTTAAPPVAVTRLLRPVHVTTRDAVSRVEIAPEPGDAFDGDPRIRALSGAEPPVQLNTGSSARRLTGAFGAANWSTGEPVRLSQNGAAVGAATITRRVTQVTLDIPPPAGMAAPVAVHLGVPGSTTFGVTLAADGASVEFGSAESRPPPATPVVVRAGAARQATVLGAHSAAKAQALDPPLTLAPGAVTLRVLSRGARLGSAAAIAAGPGLTYEPDRFGALAAAEPLWLEPRSGPVTARIGTPVSEELELDRDLPGVAGTPYAAELLHHGPRDYGRVPLEALTTIALNAPAALADPVELHVWSTAAPALSAAPLVSGATLPARDQIVVAAPAPAGLSPGQLIIVKGTGAAVEVACVRRVSVSITVDRDVNPPGTALAAVALDPVGEHWAGEWRGGAGLTVRPALATPAAGAPAGLAVEMPRLRAGELVRVETGGVPSRHRIVREPVGTTLELDPAAPAPAAGTACTVRRLDARAETGRPRRAINGRRTAAAKLTFDVWNSSDFLTGQSIGVAGEAQTLPVSIVTIDAVTIELTAPLPASVVAPVALDIAAVVAVHHPATADLHGRQLIVDTVLAPSANLVSVVALTPVAPAQAVGLGSGTVRIPADLSKELDRRQALIEHELRHMTQSAMWGPLLLAYLPLFLLEAGVDRWSDAELPKWTPYVEATVSSEGGQRLVSIATPAGYDKGSTVQLTQANGEVDAVELCERLPDGRFAAPLSISVADGPSQIRRSTDGGPWGELINVFQLLTAGGALNLVAGSVWGGLISLVGHVGHVLSRWASSEDDLHPADVIEDGRALRLAEADLSALRGSREIVVRLGDAQAVRRVQTTREDGFTLTAALPAELATGRVEVNRFTGEDPSSNWDWHDWFPASVPDPARPTRIEIHARDGTAPPEFKAHDRVAVRAGTGSVHTNVTAVQTPTTIELVELPGRGGSEPGDVLVARIGADDPLGGLDSVLLNEMGQGWMRWMFNPYGQIEYRTQPAPGSTAQGLLRVLRYALSSSSWSAGLPGHFFWDNAFSRLLRGNGHISGMEQDASLHSGDLYTTIGMLGVRPEVVGDIGSYWLFEVSRAGSSVAGASADMAGTHLKPYARLQPNRTPEAASGVTPTDVISRDTAAGPPAGRPGDALPDAFVVKPVGNPFDAPGPAREFLSTDRASIPQHAGNERVCANYFAFCRPPASIREPHRITPKGLNSTAAEDREAQDLEAQVVMHDIAVRDVTVRVGGVEVGERAAAVLVAGQVADVSVDPQGGGRDYTTTVADPAAGPLRIDASQPMRLHAPAAAAVPEPVEVSRRYAALPAGGYAHPVLAHGVHLGGDIHVPVRRFTVTVVTTLTLRSAPDLLDDHVLDDRDAAHSTSLAPGGALFVLVPAAIVSVLAPVTADPRHPGAPAGIALARPGLVVSDVTAEARGDSLVAAHLGVAGVAYRVALDPARGPELPAEWDVATKVGAAPGIALTATVKLAPAFQLAVPAAGREVARGASIVLTSDGPDLAATGVVVDPPGGIAIAVSGRDVTLTVEAAASPGRRVVSAAAATDAARVARRTIEIRT